MLKDYYRLSRPINAFAGCTAIFISAYAAQTPNWQPVFMAAVTVLLITASTNAWNDYIDIEIDKINKPDRPLPAGKIKPRKALIFSITGSLISLLTAASINQAAFFIALGANILLYLYSWKLKCTVLLGNVAVAAIIGLCFIFGGVAAENIGPTLMLAVTVFFAIMGREILKTMADYKGDLRQNCGTIAVVWGKQTARVYVIVSLLVSALLMLATYFIEQYSFVYLFIIILGMYPLFTYIAIKAKSNVPAKILEKNSTIMKYSFFVWFLAIVLGTALAG